MILNKEDTPNCTAGYTSNCTAGDTVNFTAGQERTIVQPEAISTNECSVDNTGNLAETTAEILVNQEHCPGSSENKPCNPADCTDNKTCNSGDCTDNKPCKPEDCTEITPFKPEGCTENKPCNPGDCTENKPYNPEGCTESKPCYSEDCTDNKHRNPVDCTQSKPEDCTPPVGLKARTCAKKKSTGTACDTFRSFVSLHKIYFYLIL